MGGGESHLLMLITEDRLKFLIHQRHLMTGLGTYIHLTWGIWLRYCLNERQEEFGLSWPSIFSLPEVVQFKVTTMPMKSLSEKAKV